jgi:hypothetical protein
MVPSAGTTKLQIICVRRGVTKPVSARPHTRRGARSYHEAKSLVSEGEQVMAALFKYFVGVAVILPAVMIVMPLSAVNRGEIFVGITAIAQAPAAETPMADPDRRYVVHGSLSPIYPATPGKELFGKPVYTVPLQTYAASEQDGNYLQQS